MWLHPIYWSLTVKKLMENQFTLSGDKNYIAFLPMSFFMLKQSPDPTNYKMLWLHKAVHLENS